MRFLKIGLAVVGVVLFSAFLSQECNRRAVSDDQGLVIGNTRNVIRRHGLGGPVNAAPRQISGPVAGHACQGAPARGH